MTTIIFAWLGIAVLGVCEFHLRLFPRTALAEESARRCTHRPRGLTRRRLRPSPSPSQPWLGRGRLGRSTPHRLPQAMIARRARRALLAIAAARRILDTQMTRPAVSKRHRPHPGLRTRGAPNHRSQHGSGSSGRPSRRLSTRRTKCPAARVLGGLADVSIRSSLLSTAL